MSEQESCEMTWAENSMPNWDQFSFEEELEARKLQSKIFTSTLKTEIEKYVPRIIGLEENEINNLESQLNKLKSKDDCLFTDSVNLNTNLRKLLEGIENMKNENSRLDIELNDLAKKISLKEEYKLIKEAYNIALEKYCTNFDLEINIESISEEVFKAFVKFTSIKNSIPIKITINRKQKEILDFDANDLLTNEEINFLADNPDVLNNVSVYFAKIRQHLIKKISS